MGSSRNSLNHQPFLNLKGFRFEPLPKSSSDKQPKRGPHPAPAATMADEEFLFREAMEGVIPLAEEGSHRERSTAGRSAGSNQSFRDEKCDALASLLDLVNGGKGFSVADTPEYIEGTPYQTQQGITERLHRGEFAIQDHIDLHGMTLEAGEQALENFFKRAVKQGARMLLVIHGRGKSSPVKPVLKSMVQEWLTTGPFRAWIIAYASARLCDGGAGATYVLLRHRALTKSGKRRQNRKDAYS